MDPEPRDGPSFLEELKRRKVFRVAVVYGATVFAVLQLADLLVEPLALPGWTLRFLVLLAAVGLPAALVLAWVFEVGPEGLGRTPPRDVGTPLHKAGGAPVFSRWTLVSVALLLLVGFGAGWFFGPGTAVSDPYPMGGGAAADRIRDNGIAVLPFSSRDTGEGTADFFAAGLHDDLLTRLAGLPELAVISRTSMQQFRDTRKSVPQIGRELGVAWVLEGGVQRAGERVRVNALLIDARTDEHIWAETFDGDLSVADIFAIQTHLAERIVGAMETALAVEVRLAAADLPTESMAAWEAVTRGRMAWSVNDLEAAERAFEEAVREDPAFAEAWAELSVIRSTRHWFGQERSIEALEALDRALVLAPDAASTDWAQATYEYYVLMAYPSARLAAARAVEKAPGRAVFHFTLGTLLRRVGDYPAAAASFLRALELDPRNPTILSVAIETLAVLEDTVALERWTRALVELPEVDPWSLQTVLFYVTFRGRPDRAREVLARIDPAARTHPAIELAALWMDMVDAGVERPSFDAIWAPLEAMGWPEGEGGVGSFFVSSLILPPWTERAELERVLAAVDARLAKRAGAQAAIIDRSLRAHVLARLGRRVESRTETDQVLAWVRRTDDGNVGGALLYNLALAADDLGERDRALDLLRESAERWTFPGALLLIDPSAAGLASDPRVRTLVREWTPPGQG